MAGQTIILAGAIGRANIGGKAWAYMQYLCGLRALGFDVYYLEDCGEGSWVWDWEREELSTDVAYAADYVRSCLAPIGMGERWCYRAGEQCAGMKWDDFAEACRRADLLIIRANPMKTWRAEYDLPKRRAFIDVDPGFTQVRLTEGPGEMKSTVDRCERLFTVGRRIGMPGCDVPTSGCEWITMVPPVALDHWPVCNGPGEHFTTIMDWRGFREEKHAGQIIGQKDMSFPQYLDLPARTKQSLLIGLTGAPLEKLTRHGWNAVIGWQASRTPDRYREFIQRSRAEFGVAKHGYVATQGGWFSDRSVCYLASGRPVLVHDTGLRDWLEVGEGVVTFTDADSAARGIEEINEDYERHARAARRLAETHFSAERVLGRLVDAALGD